MKALNATTFSVIAIILVASMLLTGCNNSRPRLEPAGGGSQVIEDTAIPYSSGSLIAFIGSDDNLWLMNPDGSEQRPLTALAGKVQDPAWRPDGLALAYVYQEADDEIRYIRLYDLADGRDYPLKSRRDRFLTNLSWSPDGRYLAVEFGCCLEGRTLDVIDAGSGKTVDSFAYSVRYAWSPESTRLALGVDKPLDPPIPIGGGDSVSLAIVEIGRGQPQLVMEGTREFFYWPVAWLSDGRLLYKQYDTADSSASSLWTITLEEQIGEPQPATNIPLIYDHKAIVARLPLEMQNAGLGKFSWSSDGRGAVFRAGQGTARGIYLFNWETGDAPTRLTNGGEEPVWQP